MYIEMLLSGGLNSTYLFLKQCMEECIIQPYYIIYENIEKNFQSMETYAINHTIEFLRNNEQRLKIKAYVCPLKTIKVAENTDKYDAMLNSYKSLARKFVQFNNKISPSSDVKNKLYIMDLQFHLVKSLVNLAVVSMEHKGIQIGYDKDSFEAKIIKYWGNLDGNILNTDNTDKDVNLLFGNFTFPLIDKSKKEIWDGYEYLGGQEIIKGLSICKTGTDTDSCGRCINCVRMFQSGINDYFSNYSREEYKDEQSKLKKIKYVRGSHFPWGGDLKPSGGYVIRNIEDWSVYEHDKHHWDERAQYTVSHIISTCKSVVDLGCGINQYVRKYVDNECKYIPVDYVKRSEDTVICDFNKNEFPQIEADAYLIILVLEYVKCLPEFLTKICKYARKQILIVGRPIDVETDIRNWELQPFAVAYSEEWLVEQLKKGGFALDKTEKYGRVYKLYDFRK